VRGHILKCIPQKQSCRAEFCILSERLKSWEGTASVRSVASRFNVIIGGQSRILQKNTEEHFLKTIYFCILQHFTDTNLAIFKVLFY